MTTTPTATFLPVLSVLSILPGEETTSQSISVTSGGDVDTLQIYIGTPAVPALQTGNDQALNVVGGNTIQDSYMQFNVDDAAVFAGGPTPSIRLEIEYFDQGTDHFSVQYDATRAGPMATARSSKAIPSIKQIPDSSPIYNALPIPSVKPLALAMGI